MILFIICKGNRKTTVRAKTFTYTNNTFQYIDEHTNKALMICDVISIIVW